MRRGGAVRAAAGVACGLALAWNPPARAHEGPPFPIVSGHVAGDLLISVWTDPDTTDDGSPGGQFWVMVDTASGDDPTLDLLRARVSIHPLDRPGPTQAGWAAPIDGNPSRRFVALLMDHEGPFAVRVDLDGTGPAAVVESRVDATYDLRPPPIMLAVYAVPFLLAGFLWAKLLVRRRRAATRAGA